MYCYENASKKRKTIYEEAEMSNNEKCLLMESYKVRNTIRIRKGVEISVQALSRTGLMLFSSKEIFRH